MTFGTGTTASLRLQELRNKEGILAKAALVLFLLVGAAIFFVWTRSQVVDLGLKMSELKKTENQELRRNQMLTVEKETLKSAERIEQYARERLGMAYPDPRRIKSIEGK